MIEYTDAQGWKKGNNKKLNLPFENYIMSQPTAFRERLTKRVEEYVFCMLANVLNSSDIAPLGIETILESGSYKIAAKRKQTENQLIERKMRYGKSGRYQF